MNSSAKQGFSLVEIMIVILIIAVLMAGALGGMRYLQRVKVSTTKTKLASLDTTLEQYRVDIGEYPTDLQELMDGPSKPQLQKRWAESLASEDDLLDAWANDLMYTLFPKGTRPPYELYSGGSTGDARILSPRSQGTR